MFYGFECDSCGNTFDMQFRIGECPQKVKCEKCGKEAHRVFDVPALKIGGVFKSSGKSFGDGMKKMNDTAAHRMKGRDAQRLVAYDYGGGDVREAGK